MKKMMIALVAMLAMAATGKAMSYEQARNEALFLTDKMAYELNLTDEQYEAAYEINLDYLMGVTSYDDVYGNYWERRNLDMSYILLDWQWRTFCAATYFYRPLYWSDGFWHFGIYARYPHRDYFYFGRPVFYASYRGGHAWHVVGGRGYYYGRREHFRPVGRSHFGMLDRWNRGDYRHHHTHIGYSRNGFSGGMRNSSARTTVNRKPGSFHHGSSNGGGGSFGNGRDRSYTGGGSFGNGRDRSYTGGGSFDNNRGRNYTGGGSFGTGSGRSHTGGGSFSSGNGRSYTGGGSFGTGSGRSHTGGGSFSSGATRSSGASFGGGHRGGGSQGSGHSSGGGAFGRGR